MKKHKWQYVVMSGNNETMRSEKMSAAQAYSKLADIIEKHATALEADTVGDNSPASSATLSVSTELQFVAGKLRTKVRSKKKIAQPFDISHAGIVYKVETAPKIVRLDPAE